MIWCASVVLPLPGAPAIRLKEYSVRPPPSRTSRPGTPVSSNPKRTLSVIYLCSCTSSGPSCSEGGGLLEEPGRERLADQRRQLSGECIQQFRVRDRGRFGGLAPPGHAPAHSAVRRSTCARVHAQPFVTDGASVRRARPNSAQNRSRRSAAPAATDAAPRAQPVHGSASPAAWSVIAGCCRSVVVSFHAGQLGLSWCGTAEAAKAC
jgi:hypothetical protein